jgi:hypothetical protein
MSFTKKDSRRRSLGLSGGELLDRGVAPTAPSRPFTDLSARDGLAMKWLVLSFVVASIAIFSRSPGMFAHAQFYAEDGAIWYADAYNFGWLHSLILPDGGYFNTLQRLGGGLGLLVPFQWAPLVMALMGLVLQALPVPVLLSSRCERWAPLPMRMAFAAAYVGIPNAHEIHVVCTNCQWHLAVVLGLLAFATPPRSVAGKIFDIVVVLLGAVSGPYGILLLPLLAVFWFARRQRWTAFIFVAFAAGGALQVTSLLHNTYQRNAAFRDAKVSLFIRLLGGNAFIDGLLGGHRYGLRMPFVASLAMLLLGLALCVYCAMSLSAEVRLFFVYCLLIFIGGLRSPGVALNVQNVWDALLAIPSQRYSFFPGLALIFAVLWCAGFARNRVIRMTGAVLTLALCIGIYRDWRVPALPRLNLRQQAATLNAAKPGQHVVLPVYPGGDWQIELVKK